MATIAHDPSNSLEATKAHNLEVEKRFIDNQLQKFRQQLSRQFQRTKSHRVPPTKPDFKLNNGPLVKSLAQAAQHIDNFYNTPVQALSQMAQMCSETKSEATKSLIQQLRAEPEKEAEADMDCEWTEQEAQVVEIPAFIEEQVISFDALEYRNFTKQVQADESKAKLLRCRTPSPLTSTEEFFRPMRAAAERQMLHVRTVRHEEDLLQENKQAQQPEGEPSSLKRESSTCSNTSDGIDSVISDLAEEALYELQLEAAEKENEELDKELPVPPKLVQFQLPPKKSPTLTTHPVGDSEAEPEQEPLLIRRIELPKVVVKPKEPELKQPSSSSEDESDVEPTHEKQKIIEQLFQARANTQLVVMRKYFLKWIHFTTMEKIEREQGQSCLARDTRVQKINAFLDKVRQERGVSAQKLWPRLARPHKNRWRNARRPSKWPSSLRTSRSQLDTDDKCF